jgi:hypothetical protein
LSILFCLSCPFRSSVFFFSFCLSLFVFGFFCLCVCVSVFLSFYVCVCHFLCFFHPPTRGCLNNCCIFLCRFIVRTEIECQ